MCEERGEQGTCNVRAATFRLRKKPRRITDVYSKACACTTEYWLSWGADIRRGTTNHEKLTAYEFASSDILAWSTTDTQCSMLSEPPQLAAQGSDDPIRNAAVAEQCQSFQLPNRWWAKGKHAVKTWSWTISGLTFFVFSSGMFHI
eukprot:s5436_g1.t1